MVRKRRTDTGFLKTPANPVCNVLRYKGQEGLVGRGLNTFGSASPDHGDRSPQAEIRPAGGLPTLTEEMR
jgi:hypothetical protein